MLAAQPHCEQSGVPPNWQGVIRVFRSAEIESVVRAKMQSRGDAGGLRNSSIILLGIPITGYLSRNRISSSVARLRWAGVRISGATAPTCGVKRLNQIRLVSLRAFQNRTNSSR